MKDAEEGCSEDSSSHVESESDVSSDEEPTRHANRFETGGGLV